MKNTGHSTDETIGLKAGLEFLKKPVAFCTCCGLLGLTAIASLYRPVLTKSHEAANKLSETETELSRQRAAISASQRLDRSSEILPRSDLPLVIADLTDKGRELGISFTSILPGDLRQTTQVDVGILPITCSVESEYKNIGEFLAYVEDYSRSIVEVEGFFINTNKKALPKLSADLVLNLYVDMEDAAQH